MFKLHLFTTKEDSLQPRMSYIQIKDGQTHATDAHKLLIIDNEKVFGKDVFENTDLCYIQSKYWQALKFDKATSFKLTRYEHGQPNRLTAYNKSGELGTIDLLISPGGNSYPNTSAVIPTQKDPVTIGINVKQLYEAAQGLNSDVLALTFDLDNKGRAIMLEVGPAKKETTGDAKILIMPVNLLG